MITRAQKKGEQPDMEAVMEFLKSVVQSDRVVIGDADDEDEDGGDEGGQGNEEEEGESEAEVERMVVDEEDPEDGGTTDLARFLKWFGMTVGGGRRRDETQRERDAATRAD